MKRAVAASLLALLAGGGVIAAACTSFTDQPEVAPDGSTDGSSANDGGDAADGDVHIDATPIEDGGIADADPCTLDAYFCDDFERQAPDLLGAEWSLVNPGYGPAAIGIFTVDARDSPPSGTRVLRARHRIPEAGTDGGADSSRYLYFTYQGSPAALDVSFAMKLLAVPKPRSQLVEIAFAPTADAGESAIVISVDSNERLHLFEELTAGSSGNADVNDVVVVGKWLHYRLRVDLPNKQARLTMEGRTQDLVLDLERTHGSPKAVRVGVVYEPTQTSNTDTWIDDVVIRR